MDKERKLIPDRPMRAGDSEAMRLLCKQADRLLPDGTGYIILGVSLADEDKTRPLRYTSNITREDAIKLLKDFLFHCGEEENWMRHIK